MPPFIFADYYREYNMTPPAAHVILSLLLGARRARQAAFSAIADAE